jgi:hypothetical protein
MLSDVAMIVCMMELFWDFIFLAYNKDSISW